MNELRNMFENFLVTVGTIGIIVYYLRLVSNGLAAGIAIFLSGEILGVLPSLAAHANFSLLTTAAFAVVISIVCTLFLRAMIWR